VLYAKQPNPDKNVRLNYRISLLPPHPTKRIPKLKMRRLLRRPWESSFCGKITHNTLGFHIPSLYPPFCCSKK
jgi:hypothetical protein